MNDDANGFWNKWFEDESGETDESTPSTRRQNPSELNKPSSLSFWQCSNCEHGRNLESFRTCLKCSNPRQRKKHSVCQSLQVQLSATEDKRAISLSVDPSWSIETLRKKILQQPTVADAYRRFCPSLELEDDEDGRGLDKLVRHLSSHTRILALKPDNKVFYQLSDRLLIKQSKLHHESTVQLALGKKYVVVDTLWGELLTVEEFDYPFTIGTLADKIRELRPKETDKYHEFFLQDSKTGIIAQDDICVYELPSMTAGSLASNKAPMMHSHVKHTHSLAFNKVLMMHSHIMHVHTLVGAVIDVPFGEQTTFEEVRDFLVEHHQSIPRERQRLVFQGKIINPDNMFYRVATRSVLYLLDFRGDFVADNYDISRKANCSIAKTELRSLTLHQLKHLAIQVVIRCQKEQWTSTDPAMHGKLLAPEEVTLYDLVHHYIKPATSKEKCSYVELVASGPAKPQWFVSHWWGNSVFHLIACIEQHACDRFLENYDDVKYWICAFANNQHNLEQELTSNPTESPFFRAMQLSAGTVSIVDTKMECFSRIWCGFEVTAAIRDMSSTDRHCGYDDLYDAYTIDRSKKKSVDLTGGLAAVDARYLYDIYTINTSKNKSVGITDGPAAVDSPGAVDNTADDNQSKRQRFFPLCPLAFDISIENARASVEADRRNILQFISRSSSPPATHESYDEINASLRGKFALSTYQVALERGAALDRHLEALSKYKSLTSLHVRHSACTPFRREASNFMLALPLHLQHLHLDYSAILFENSCEFAVGLSRLSSLQSFKLVAKHCIRLTCIDSLASELGQLHNLKHLSLDLSSCSIDVKSLLQAFTKLVDLESLDLCFQSNTKLKLSSDRLSCFSELLRLRVVVLDFSKCSLTCEDIDEVLYSLCGMQNEVCKLKVNLGGNPGSRAETQPSPRRRKQIIDHYQWDESTAANVDWEAYGSFQSFFGVFSAELFHMSFPEARRKNYDLLYTKLQCPSIERAMWREDLYSAICSRSAQLGTDPALLSILLVNIQDWLEGREGCLSSDDQMYLGLITSQASIGWGNLFRGLWSSQWAFHQERYYADGPFQERTGCIDVSNETAAHSWVASMIHVLWKHCAQLALPVNLATASCSFAG